MRRIILIFGSIAGAIVAAMFIITMPLYEKGVLNLDNGAITGYTTMVIAFSMIFFGVKSYRDNYSGGSIGFWKACQVGILIALLATIIYAVAWEFYYNIFYPNFMEVYANLYIAKAKAHGASAQELQNLVIETNKWKEIYDNPVLRFLFTMMEPLPVGIGITLFSAAVLRKKQVLPA
jgi:hypothetical protein